MTNCSVITEAAEKDAKTSLFLSFCSDLTLCPIGTMTCSSFIIIMLLKCSSCDSEMPVISLKTNHVTDSEHGGVVRLPEYLKNLPKSLGSMSSSMIRDPARVTLLPCLWTL